MILALEENTNSNVNNQNLRFSLAHKVIKPSFQQAIKKRPKSTKNKNRRKLSGLHDLKEVNSEQSDDIEEYDDKEIEEILDHEIDLNGLKPSNNVDTNDKLLNKNIQNLQDDLNANKNIEAELKYDLQSNNNNEEETKSTPTNKEHEEKNKDNSFSKGSINSEKDKNNHNLNIDTNLSLTNSNINEAKENEANYSQNTGNPNNINYNFNLNLNNITPITPKVGLENKSQINDDKKSASSHRKNFILKSDLCKSNISKNNNTIATDIYGRKKSGKSMLFDYFYGNKNNKKQGGSCGNLREELIFKTNYSPFYNMENKNYKKKLMFNTHIDDNLLIYIDGNRGNIEEEEDEDEDSDGNDFGDLIYGSKKLNADETDKINEIDCKDIFNDQCTQGQQSDVNKTQESSNTTYNQRTVISQNTNAFNEQLNKSNANYNINISNNNYYYSDNCVNYPYSTNTPNPIQMPMPQMQTPYYPQYYEQNMSMKPNMNMAMNMSMNQNMNMNYIYKPNLVCMPNSFLYNQNPNIIPIQMTPVTTQYESAPPLVEYNDESLAENSQNLIREQMGCRFIQEKIMKDEKFANNLLFPHLMNLNNLPDLICDQFGNYFFQVLIEHLHQDNLSKFITIIAPNLFDISISLYGTRVIQKLIEEIQGIDKLREELLSLFKNKGAEELIELMKDPYGNHIIQKYLTCMRDINDIKFIYNVITDHFLSIVCSKHGVCVVQKAISNNFASENKIILSIVKKNINEIITDQYANYLIQYLLASKEIPFNQYEDIFNYILNNIFDFCKIKFPANIIEKCFENSTYEIKIKIIQSLLKNDHYIPYLLNDIYGNYVIQKALMVSNDENYKRMIGCIKMGVKEGLYTSFGNRVVCKLATMHKDIKCPHSEENINYGGVNSGSNNNSALGNRNDDFKKKKKFSNNNVMQNNNKNKKVKK